MRPRPDLPHLELPLASGRGRAGAALGVSLLAHVALMAIVVLAGRGDSDAERTDVREPDVRRVDLVSLPPLLEPRPRVEERRVEPAPQRVPRPQVRRGDELPEAIATRSDPPPMEFPLGDPPPATAPLQPAEPKAEAEAPTELAAATEMESEARRLFGPRNRGFDHADGPRVTRRWATEVTEDRENDCTPRPAPPRPAGAPPELGTVAGTVYREGTNQPLAGAFLQILGTPYSTFADDRGAYILAFDRALVDACRTQYVQVSKDGFAPRRLILSLGSRARNDIPLSRR